MAEFEQRKTAVGEALKNASTYANTAKSSQAGAGGAASIFADDIGNMIDQAGGLFNTLESRLATVCSKVVVEHDTTETCLDRATQGL